MTSLARPNNELPDEPDLPCVALAADLRVLRERAGLTIGALSQITGLATGTLSGAQSGVSVPSEKTLKAFVTACGDAEATAWLVRREAALRGQRPASAGYPTRRMVHEDRIRPAWRATWRRWDKTGRLTPPSGATGPRALPFWLLGLRAYRSMPFRAMARQCGYAHSTLAAMANGFQPVTVRGLLAFLDACRVSSFAERVEWLELLERTCTSPRRRLDAAREQVRLRALMSGKPSDASGEAASTGGHGKGDGPYDWSELPRSAWPRQRAVHVDRYLLKTDLQALNRFYGSQFLPLLARHTGIGLSTLRRYLRNEVGFLGADQMNRLAAALVRLGSTPPTRDRLASVLSPSAAWAGPGREPVHPSGDSVRGGA
ncbi:helix-turn-helix domain-containing protein [Streptomyces sp. NPDC057148]|uniref:helix-turn-helix domain-containing protein n=1 Tax=unclassified Streptomyces TaxID=2593676 RepID=UPI00363D61FE